MTRKSNKGKVTQPKVSKQINQINSISTKTIKRLFALSGNRCAFPKCKSTLVDFASGTILAEICHIKGEKPLSKRYDRYQSSSERSGFENLLLLCGSHHKIIDDSDSKYTTIVLAEMKRKHEEKHSVPFDLPDELISTMQKGETRFDAARIQFVSTGQSGGQIAHTINNYSNDSDSDTETKLEGKISIDSNERTIRKYGCPGAKVTIVCRSKTEARIKNVDLCVVGRGFVMLFEQGFDSNFKHDPPEGMEDETLHIKLYEINTRNSQHGHILHKGDICEYFFPLYSPAVTHVIAAKPEMVYLRAVAFDDSEQILLRGEPITHIIRELMTIFGTMEYTLNFPQSISLSVKSKSLPHIAGLTGKINPKAIRFDKSDTDEVKKLLKRYKVHVVPGLIESAETLDRTIGFSITNTDVTDIPEVFVRLEVADNPTVSFVSRHDRILHPKCTMHAILPFRYFDYIQFVLGKIPNSSYRILIGCSECALFVLSGIDFQAMYQKMMNDQSER